MDPLARTYLREYTLIFGCELSAATHAFCNALALGAPFLPLTDLSQPTKLSNEPSMMVHSTIMMRYLLQVP